MISDPDASVVTVGGRWTGGHGEGSSFGPTGALKRGARLYIYIIYPRGSSYHYLVVPKIKTMDLGSLVPYIVVTGIHWVYIII